MLNQITLGACTILRRLSDRCLLHICSSISQLSLVFICFIVFLFFVVSPYLLFLSLLLLCCVAVVGQKQSPHAESSYGITGLFQIVSQCSTLHSQKSASSRISAEGESAKTQEPLVESVLHVLHILNTLSQNSLFLLLLSLLTLSVEIYRKQILSPEFQALFVASPAKSARASSAPLTAFVQQHLQVESVLCSVLINVGLSRECLALLSAPLSTKTEKGREDSAASPYLSHVVQCLSAHTQEIQKHFSAQPLPPRRLRLTLRLIHLYCVFFANFLDNGLSSFAFICELHFSDLSFSCLFLHLRAAAQSAPPQSCCACAA